MLRLKKWMAVMACVAMPVQAAPQAVVDTVQMPAWLERGDRVQPLAIGMEIRHGDRIRTGADARAYLKLAEGSTVKLGENAALGFYSRSLKPQRNLKGALDVQKGAFSFTTDTQLRAKVTRDLSIRVGALTIGVREPGGLKTATSVLGKSDSLVDLACLIEGSIELAHAGQTGVMDEPMAFVAMRKDEPPQPQLAASAEPEQIKHWERETEVLPGAGATHRGGRWKLLLARADSQQQALDVYDTARAAGYAAQIRVRPADGDWSYEIFLASFSSENEAMVVARKIKNQLGLDATPVK